MIPITFSNRTGSIPLADLDTNFQYLQNEIESTQQDLSDTQQELSELLANATDVIPLVNNTHDLGSATNRWRNIYTNDLQLSNGIGDYTIVEGADDLFLYNNKNGKTYKFALIEVDKNEVPAKCQ